MEEESDPIRFSVVVPAYNEAAFLGRALEALLRQDLARPYEVIVVDNNSTDDTAAVAASYGVRVVAEPQQGVCAARQRGAEVAGGEILVSTDADTTQPRDWLRTIDAHFAASEEIVAVAGPCRYAKPSWWAKAYPKMLFGAVAGVFAATGFVFYVSATNIAVRQRAFPGYDLNQTQGGDELDLLRRLRRRGKVVWDRRNVVTTSARRLQRGLLYNVVVSFLIFYVLAYVLNRLAPHRSIGMAPAFRQETTRPRRSRRRVVVGVMVIALASLGIAVVAGPTAFADLHRFWHKS